MGFVQLEGAYRKAQVEADLPEDDSIFKWEVASVYRTSAFLSKEGPKRVVLVNILVRCFWYVQAAPTRVKSLQKCR